MSRTLPRRTGSPGSDVSRTAAGKLGFSPAMAVPILCRAAAMRRRPFVVAHGKCWPPSQMAGVYRGRFDAASRPTFDARSGSATIPVAGQRTSLQRVAGREPQRRGAGLIPIRHWVAGMVRPGEPASVSV